MGWIMRDRWNAKERDREALRSYLLNHQIEPCCPGYLMDVIGSSASDNQPNAWRYLSYAVENYPAYPGIKKKFTELAKISSKEMPSDMPQYRQNESNWRATLLEFKALYTLTKFFGYQFEDFDRKAPHARGNENCDLVLRCKEGRRIYADAKAWCYDIRTTIPDSHQGIRIYRYNPLPKSGPVNTYPKPGEDLVQIDMTKVGRWLEEKLKDVRKKGAHVLVCDLPVWPPRDNLDRKRLEAYCDQMLPGKLQWQSDGPIWVNLVPVTTVENIVIVKRIGCWSIRVLSEADQEANQLIRQPADSLTR